MNRPPKSKAIERLQKVLDEIPELKNLPRMDRRNLSSGREIHALPLPKRS